MAFAHVVVPVYCASSSSQRCSEGAAEGFHQHHDITERSNYDPLVILINVKCILCICALCINTAEVKNSVDEGPKVQAQQQRAHTVCSSPLFTLNNLHQNRK